MGSAGKLLPEHVLPGWGRCAPQGSERRWQCLPLEPRQEAHCPRALYVYTLHMHSVCTTYAPHVHYKYAIHDIYAICALHVHHMYNRDTIYALYMHYICTICGLLTTYKLHMHYAYYSIYILYIHMHYVYTIWALHVHHTDHIYVCCNAHV